MARRMAEESFRREQWEHRYDPHIAPINQLVDELRKGMGAGDSTRWAPYVAPMYGGVNARILSVLRDPGPMTQDGKGSGFLCMENDDPTAEAISGLFAGVSIGAHEIVPWNVYPWYINRAPTAAELEAGIEPLKQIIDLLPKLQVVMLHGGHAQNGWKRFTRRYPDLVTNQKLEVIETFHTSRQAFWHADPSVREARREHLRTSFENAGRYLNAP